MSNPIFGKISPPKNTFLDQSVASGGLISFFSNLLNLIITLAGIFALLNFIMSGYGYLTSNGDPQKIANAGNKILQSVIGIIVIAASFIIAGLLGQIFFKDPTALIKPKFFGIQ